MVSAEVGEREMKHKWKPIYDYPAYWPGYQRCIVCETTFQAPYDYLDSEKTAKFVTKQKARNDCSGKKT